MINALTHLVNILPSTPERWFVWHDQHSYTFGEHSTQYTRKVVCLTWSMLLHIWWTFYPVHQKGGLFDMINALTHLVNILTSTPERWLQVGMRYCVLNLWRNKDATVPIRFNTHIVHKTGIHHTINGVHLCWNSVKYICLKYSKRWSSGKGKLTFYLWLMYIKTDLTMTI
jgi:hypothetical protein